MCGRLEELTTYVIVVMVAEVCLPNGRHIKRAINHLYPLEVAECDENLKFKEAISR